MTAFSRLIVNHLFEVERYKENEKEALAQLLCNLDNGNDPSDSQAKLRTLMQTAPHHMIHNPEHWGMIDLLNCLDQKHNENRCSVIVNAIRNCVHVHNVGANPVPK